MPGTQFAWHLDDASSSSMAYENPRGPSRHSFEAWRQTWLIPELVEDEGQGIDKSDVVPTLSPRGDRL